jgi:hypothetical protein
MSVIVGGYHENFGYAVVVALRDVLTSQSN